MDVLNETLPINVSTSINYEGKMCESQKKEPIAMDVVLTVIVSNLMKNVNYVV